MPGHVLRIPPGILQSLPEQSSLPDSPDFMPPRHHAFLAILDHQLAQRIHQIRPQFLQPLVVRAERQLSQRLLHISRRLAVDADRPPSRQRFRLVRRATCGERTLRTIQGRNKSIVGRFRITVQNPDIIKII
jgi:hypothetical protein